MKKNANLALDMLKNPVRAFEKSYEDAQLDVSNDEYHKGTCLLLRAKAKQQMHAALESFTSGAAMPFGLLDVKATIAELNLKSRTASCHANAMHTARLQLCAVTTAFRGGASVHGRWHV